jgi:hypothetical protein
VSRGQRGGSLTVVNLSFLDRSHGYITARKSPPKVKVNTGDVRFEVSKAVTMKNSVFWNVTPRGSCKN